MDASRRRFKEKVCLAMQMGSERPPKIEKLGGLTISYYPLYYPYLGDYPFLRHSAPGPLTARFGSSWTLDLGKPILKFPVGRFDDEKKVIDVWPGIFR